MLADTILRLAERRIVTGDFSSADRMAAYDRIAPAYDRMIGLSPGHNFHLQSAADALVEKLPPRPDLTVVDLGCGTGASTDALANSLGHRGYPFQLVGIDSSPGMLAQAAAKPWPTWVSFSAGDAQQLETAVAPSSLAGVMAAQLFSSVEDRATALKSVWSALAPGGVLVIQDYALQGCSPAGVGAKHAIANRRLAWARGKWSTGSWALTIPMAKLVGRDTTIYRQRWSLVLSGSSVAEFISQLQLVGFAQVEHRTVTGWRHNLLHTLRATKPN